MISNRIQNRQGLRAYRDANSAAAAGTKTRLAWFSPLNVFFFLYAVKLVVNGIHEGQTFFFVSKPIDLLFALALIGYTLANVDFYFKKYPYPSLLMLAFVAGTILTELVNKGDLIYGLFNAFKFIIPFLFLLVMLKVYEEDRDHLMGWIRLLVFLVFVLTAIGLAILPRETNRMQEFLPAYFLNLHSSSYVLLMAAIAVYYFAKSSVIRPSYALLLILYAAGLILVGWGIRTAMVSLAAFAIIEYFRNDFRKWLAAYLLLTLVFLLAFIGVFFLNIGSLDYERVLHFSSGRLGMWSEKLSFLAASTFKEFVFGHGAGSDLMKSDVWWWAAKDSHNDYLRILTENGITGLATALGFIGALYAALARRAFVLPLFAMYLAASALSNGLFFRPVPAQAFMLALIVALDSAARRQAVSNASGPAPRS